MSRLTAGHLQSSTREPYWTIETREPPYSTLSAHERESRNTGQTVVFFKKILIFVATSLIRVDFLVLSAPSHRGFKLVVALICLPEEM